MALRNIHTYEGTGTDNTYQKAAIATYIWRSPNTMGVYFRPLLSLPPVSCGTLLQCKRRSGYLL